MKTLCIFIASSICEEELKDDRDWLVTYSAISPKEQGKYVKLILCERENQFIAQDGKQNELDKKLLGSDIALFLIGERVGEYTGHELCVAEEGFKAAGKPRIVIRFRKKYLEESETNQRLYERCKEAGYDCSSYSETKDLLSWLDTVIKTEQYWE